MTVTHRKPQLDEIQTVSEPGLQFHCDSCACDLTHSVRIKCADPVCEPGDGIDLCPPCFCAGKEFGQHRKYHPYRIIELNSYPIFSEDWGADEELLLLAGITSQGIGNWKKIAEHVGTRTKEEVEVHYNSVYVDSPTWPLPRMDATFEIDPTEFQARKRRRISAMTAQPVPPAKPAPTSAPGIHEVATFLPGRLEFEHELDNDAEDLVKDLEFGICHEYGGDQIPEDENDVDVRARIKWNEERRQPNRPGDKSLVAGKGPIPGLVNGTVNGHHANGNAATRDSQPKSEDGANGSNEDEAADDEITQPPPIETPESLKFKLTLIEMYSQRVDKRHEAKALLFDRGLLEYKKLMAAEKKRPKEEKEVIQRLKPFAKLQAGEDFEVFTTDILYEAMLRKRIQELQAYRRLGLQSAADIDKYESDLITRRSQPKVAREAYSDRRRSNEREFTPKPGPTAPRKPPAPLNLANSPCLHLLTPAEQTLCSALRILPKPYLVIKETLVREYARRGGKLRRREARDLVKIDVNKTSRVWDFLVQAGFLKITAEPAAQPNTSLDNSSRTGSNPPLNGSPLKESLPRNSPRPIGFAHQGPPTVNGTGFSAPPAPALPSSWTPH